MKKTCRTEDRTADEVEKRSKQLPLPASIISQFCEENLFTLTLVTIIITNLDKVNSIQLGELDLQRRELVAERLRNLSILEGRQVFKEIA